MSGQMTGSSRRTPRRSGRPRRPASRSGGATVGWGSRIRCSPPTFAGCRATVIRAACVRSTGPGCWRRSPARGRCWTGRWRSGPDRGAPVAVPLDVGRDLVRRPGVGPAGGQFAGQRGGERPVTVSRPPVLRVGDEVEIGGAVHTVTGLSGSGARLADVTGSETSMTLAELLSAPGFRMAARPPAALPPQGLMDALPEEAADQALWWERRIVEVITGIPPGSVAGTRPRPEYDPETRTLRQRRPGACRSGPPGPGHAADNQRRLPLCIKKPSPGHDRRQCRIRSTADQRDFRE